MLEKIPYKWLSFTFLLTSIIPIYFINTLSKGNFLAGFVSLLLFCTPSVITQAVILFVIWKNQFKPALNFVFTSVSLLVLCFEMFVLYKYVTGIS